MNPLDRIQYEAEKAAAQRDLTAAHQAYEKAACTLGFEHPDTDAARARLEAVKADVKDRYSRAVGALIWGRGL